MAMSNHREYIEAWWIILFLSTLVFSVCTGIKGFATNVYYWYEWHFFLQKGMYSNKKMQICTYSLTEIHMQWENRIFEHGSKLAFHCRTFHKVQKIIIPWIWIN